MKTNIMNFKFVLLLALLAFASSSQAKVGDFNELIDENVKSQQKLHESLSQNMEAQRAEQATASSTISNGSGSRPPIGQILIDSEPGAVTAPTSKSLLTFKKEVKFYRPSESKTQKRLAEEIGDAK